MTYEGKSINVVGLDIAKDGLNLSKQSLDTLTGGRAYEVGRIDATVTRVDSGVCGLRASKREITFMG